MDTRPFDRFAGLCAILVGIIGFLYSIAFIVLQSPLLSGLLLLVGGILTTAVLTGLYGRLREMDPWYALWALLLGSAGAVGSAMHGGYDLALAIHPPTSMLEGLPNQVDPRGLLTFGVAGIAVFIFSRLIRRAEGFPGGLGLLGYVLAILLVILYLGRLIVLSPTNLVVLVPALLIGFIINPVWYIWLGNSLWRT